MLPVPVYYTKWCTGQIRYKKLEDVASVEEFWQWLEGPFAHNIIYCAKGTGGGPTYRTDGGGGGGAEAFNAEDLLPGNRRPCRVGDGKFVRTGAVQIRSIRVQRRACEFGWADAWDSNRTLFKGYVLDKPLCLCVCVHIHFTAGCYTWCGIYIFYLRIHRSPISRIATLFDRPGASTSIPHHG